MSGKIRTALIGVGNSACILTQGLKFYGEDPSRPGLWHKAVGGYGVSDIKVVEAFDVDSRKVGLDISEALFIEPNRAARYLNLEKAGVTVSRGMLKDQISSSLSSAISPEAGRFEDIVDHLKAGRVDVAVNLISSGQNLSSRAYAEAAIEAGCCFVNATTTPVASDVEVASRFRSAGLLVAGDDLLSQLGGTAFHKGLLSFMGRRGIRVEKSYQLDVGGGTETLNTIDEHVRDAKRLDQKGTISIETPYEFQTVAGTTDYVDYMGNRRNSYLWIVCEGFLGAQFKIDACLKTDDGANAGNVLLDLIRAVKSAKDRGLVGAHEVICGYGFKRPPRLLRLEDAYRLFEEEFTQ